MSQIGFNKTSNFEKVQSYQAFLDENIELKKIINKLENQLKRENSEKLSLQRLHEDFKILHEKTRKELSDINNRLIATINEKNIQERRFENEIDKLKTFYEKQKEQLESQLINLSSVEVESIKIKVALEVEDKYRKEIEYKDLENEQLNENKTEIEKKYELLLTEYETIKTEALKEIDLMQDSHKAEIRELLFKIQLLTEKGENSIDRDQIRELRNNYDLIRKQNVEYLSEINSLRREKENFLLDRNEIRLGLMKELDADKMKYKILEAENERKDHIIKNLEFELSHLKTKFEDKTDEIKSLLEEKYELARQLKEKELDFESFKAEVKVLRQKIEERDNEISETINLTSDKEKLMFIQDRNEKEELHCEIENLSRELKESQIDFKNFYEKANQEIHTWKRDYYIISEEKRIIQTRVHELQQDLEFIKEDYDRKATSLSYLEKEIASIQDRYRDLTIKEAENHKDKMELELRLKKKNEELEEANKNNNNLIKMMKDNTYSDKTIRDLIMKKENYKEKVR